MRLTVSFDPEDGTGAITKTKTLYDPYSYTPDGLWYSLVMCMKEIIHTWRWSRAGKPHWEEKEKRIAWKTEAREWTEPIDVMIAATKELDKSLDSPQGVGGSSGPLTSSDPKSAPTVDGSASTE